MVELKHKRSRTEVIIDLLSEAVEGANKTRLMYRCNLNFVQFNRYLQEFLDAGLIECDYSIQENMVLCKIYKTTERGRRLLKVLRKANEFLAI